MKSIVKLVLGVAVSIGAILSPEAQAQQVQWVNTATQGLTSLTSAVDLGVVPPDMPVTVRLALSIQNKSALLQFIQSVNDPNSSLYGQFLTPQQFTAQYSPSAAQVQSVVSYLTGAGLQNIQVEPNNLMISATGSAAQVSQAFNTQLDSFAQNGQTVFANVLPAQVPASLGGLVAAVLGLNNAGQFRSFLQTTASSSPASLPVPAPRYPALYTPQGYWHAYNATNVAFANRAKIAIFAEGNVSGVLNDLRLAEAAFSLPQVSVHVVQVGLPSPDTVAVDEWDLDTQYSTGMAGNVSALYIYATTSLSDSDVALEFNRFVTDNVARAASASFGLCEVFAYLDGSMLADDQVFLEGAAQGQTVFTSSGDTGGFCPAGPAGVNGVPAGAPFVNYPAASPYVVSVGGTTLLTNTDGSYDTEVAWWAGGGGISQFEGAPFWQSAANVPSAAAYSRGVPDIAMVADPESGAKVYINGAPEGVGGTSLSSPMALGVWARMISQNPKLGFAPLRLYGLYNGTGTVGTYPQGGFHDIILGENNPYPATPGWDFTTGLGTLWVSQLSTALAH